MKMQYYIVDAFATDIFGGNPAGVCLVEQPLEDGTMQNIAAENNLSETAFIFRNGGDFKLRWFTPETEIDLCGHATLASAYIISKFVDTQLKEMKFHTLSGILTVTKNGDLFEMDFPAREPLKTSVSPLMEKAIGTPVLEAHLSRDMLLLIEDENTLRSLQPDLSLLSKIPDCFAVIITAKADNVDFVSRFFVPNAGIPEDPVTGSSHSTLIPFWAKRLGKRRMIAKQLSKRGGTLYCENCDDRVKISGYASLYLAGEINI